MMISIMMQYPFVESSYEFTQIPLKKSINAKVLTTAPINNFILTRPTECLPPIQQHNIFNNQLRIDAVELLQFHDSCQPCQQQLDRLRDLNGTKGTPNIQELFDMRPCYLRKAFRNVWHFNDCFHHVKTSNLTQKHPEKITHSIHKEGNKRLQIVFKLNNRHC